MKKGFAIIEIIMVSILFSVLLLVLTISIVYIVNLNKTQSYKNTIYTKIYDIENNIMKLKSTYADDDWYINTNLITINGVEVFNIKDNTTYTYVTIINEEIIEIDFPNIITITKKGEHIIQLSISIDNILFERFFYLGESINVH